MLCIATALNKSLFVKMQVIKTLGKKTAEIFTTRCMIFSLDMVCGSARHRGEAAAAIVGTTPVLGFGGLLFLLSYNQK